MEKYWFQLPPSSAIDISQTMDFLSRKKWINYHDLGESFDGYAGIGLTSRSKSAEHINDALEVLQTIGNYEKGQSEYNWQAVSVWNENVTDYLEDVFSSFKLPPLRARFSKMEPRSNVPRHIDDYSENVTRVHWPIVTDEKNVFCFYEGDKLVEKIHMPAGGCYAIDSTVPHAFYNFSRVTERIHLVVNFGMSFSDFKVWIRENELFNKPVATSATLQTL